MRDRRGARLGYLALRLDTLPQMREAQALYAELGFADTPPYNDNPVEGVRFLALDLERSRLALRLLDPPA